VTRDPNGEDPDIAGIVPGPQPVPWEMDDEAEAGEGGPVATEVDTEN